jgi:hypothetical protein
MKRFVSPTLVLAALGVASVLGKVKLFGFFQG